MKDERDHIEALLRVARMYYLEELSQEEIASQVAFSRSTISRMLDEARKRHIVRFSIGHPMEREADLERRMIAAALEEAKFNQRKAAQLLQLTYHQFRGYYRKHVRL